MARKSLLLLTLVSNLGLFAGCQSSNSCGPRQSFFSRLFGPREECCEVMSPCCEGPMMMDAGPMLAAPPAVAPANGLAPQNAMPPLAPAPRLVPQPQSQPQAYSPTAINR
ncbi:MAG: hypothetical protein JNM56_32715 [Planctomycetia bacterium]|nr:hypothetical protein [Planctomycetia bacterium]